MLTYTGKFSCLIVRDVPIGVAVQTLLSKPLYGMNIFNALLECLQVIPRLAQYEANVSDETIVKKLPLYDKLVNKGTLHHLISLT